MKFLAFPWDMFRLNYTERNKPSFCSGSCDEWHAKKTFKNRTTLKHPHKSFKLSLNTLTFSWNFLETSMKDLWNFYERSLKLLWKILETSMRDPWNPLKTPLETGFKGLNHLWNTIETPLKSPCGTHETFLKHLGYSLKHLQNFHTLQ